MAERNRQDARLGEWFFVNQSAMQPATVKTAARDVGGVANFDADYAAALERVKADVALAISLGVDRTPTFFINGIKIEGALPLQYFDAAIALELRQGK
jgi:protein-disulfide isomerase